MEDLKTFVESVGTPVGLIGVVAFAIWRFFRWAAPLGQQFVVSQIELTSKVSDSQEKISDSIQNMESHIGDMSVSIKSLATKIDIVAHSNSRQ